MSDFEGSDLTDLEDDETYDPKAPSQSKRAKVDQLDDSYRIKGALRAPRTTTCSTQALHEQLVGNDISLEADYQRDVVWPVNKQIGLIDSLFRNFYVPPVIFSVTELPDGGQKRICIDGKQRLTSVWRFMEGLIPYKDAYTGQKFFYKDLPDRTEKGGTLPERYRKIFRNKQIVCMEYSDLTDNNEREVFQRVQLGMALTPAEKLQAVHSHHSSFIRDLLREYVNDRLTDHLAWEVGRANDFRGLCTAIYMVDKNLPTLPTIPALTKWLQEEDEYDDEFVEDVHQTFKIFVWLAEDSECSKCFNLKRDNKQLKVSPAEFVSIFVLIHKHKSGLTMKQLSEGIRKMRLDIRKMEQDIRLNTRCMKYLQNFIKEMTPSDFKSDPGYKSAAVSIKKLFKARPRDADSDADVDPVSPTKAPGKRKRRDDDEEAADDAEYVPNKPSASSQRTPLKPALKPAVKRSPGPDAPLIPPAVAPASAPTPIHRPPPPSQPARPPSTAPPAPPVAGPSARPPASVHPPTAPRFHPDRLAALHAAKSGVPIPQYASPNAPHGHLPTGPNGLPAPPHHSLPPPIPPLQYSSSRWGESVMRMGPVVPLSEQSSSFSTHASQSRLPATDGYVDEPAGSGRGYSYPTPPTRPMAHARDDFHTDRIPRRYSRY